jgi:hypothetical protein
MSPALYETIGRNPLNNRFGNNQPLSPALEIMRNFSSDYTLLDTVGSSLVTDYISKILTSVKVAICCEVTEVRLPLMLFFVRSRILN